MLELLKYWWKGGPTNSGTHSYRIIQVARVTILRGVGGHG